MGEAHSPTITDQPLHLEIGGHQLGSESSFEWNDPPRPFAVPDTTSPCIAYPPIFFLGEFFRDYWRKNIPHIEYSALMEGNVEKGGYSDKRLSPVGEVGVRT
jgi:hypothetical protein